MFSSGNEFSLHIETLRNQQGLSYVDTILNYCEERDIDVEDITSLINTSLRNKIATEVKIGTKKVELELYDFDGI